MQAAETGGHSREAQGNLVVLRVQPALDPGCALPLVSSTLHTSALCNLDNSSCPCPEGHEVLLLEILSFTEWCTRVAWKATLKPVAWWEGEVTTGTSAELWGPVMGPLGSGSGSGPCEAGRAGLARRAHRACLQD